MNAPRDGAVLVIGVGNEYRGDDGVGAFVARAVAQSSLPDVVVQMASGEGAALIEAWQGYTHVILIDATCSRQTPGLVHRFEAADHTLPVWCFRHSTHEFSLGEAVELARVLGQLPTRLTVYGIEGRAFDAGRHLSTEVKAAALDVVQQIRSEIENRIGDSSPCTKCPS